MKRLIPFLLVLSLVKCHKDVTTKILYAELTPQEFREKIVQTPVAYLPLGTIEWHGEHLPLGSDGLQSFYFFRELAGEVGGIVLPMLFLGPDRVKQVDDRELYGMDICTLDKDSQRYYADRQLSGSAYWISDTLFTQMAEAILKQLSRAGFKIVVAHGHGPSTNTFIRRHEQWEEKFQLKLLNCWGSDWDREGRGIMVDHAAMNETSLMMAFRPDLVDMKRLPESPDLWPVGVSGRDPRINASEKLGQEILKLNKQRMIKMIRAALSEIE